MVIKTEVKTREEYCRFFCSNVTNYKSFSSGIYSRPRGELYGSIDGNDIWIVKTKQIIANLPQRFFEGKIVESSGNIQIVGKIWQPIKFCVNNNPSSNNRTLDCGAIRLPDLPRVNSSFLSAECYARQSVNNILRTGNSILGGKSSWYSVLKYYR